MWRRSGREIGDAYARNQSPFETFRRLDPPVPILHIYGQPQDPEYLALQQRFAGEYEWFSVRKLDATTHFAMLEEAHALADAIEAFVSEPVRPDCEFGEAQRIHTSVRLGASGETGLGCGTRVSDRYQRGLDAYASQLGIAPESVPGWFASRFGERFAVEAINAAGGAWVDDDLSLRDRSLVVIAALVVQGGAEQRLRTHVRWAVAHDLTGDQLEAAITLLATYAGYPRASIAMEVVRDELDQMGRQSVKP
jgi:alkylhydroperoxidase/carboxymuconolactone decarboxylase family protein YurZ